MVKTFRISGLIWIALLSALAGEGACSLDVAAPSLVAADQLDFPSNASLIITGVQADFEISAGSRTSLVSCKRWKVARTGIEPLRALHTTQDAGDTHDWIYVAAGEITENARRFAGEQKIRLIEGAELARLMGRNPDLLSQQVSDRNFP